MVNMAVYFLLALTEVNVKLGLMGFQDDENIAMLKFRKKLARALIFNSWYTQERMLSSPTRERNTPQRRHLDVHELRTRPIFTGQYDDATRKFVKTKKKYSVLRCTSCGHKTRNYCSCNPAGPLCDRCHGVHRLT